jgi:hypothetical protein
MADVHRLRSLIPFVAALVAIAGAPNALGVTRFPSEDEALARPSMVVKSGTTSAQYRVASPPADTTYDLRGLTSTAYPFTTTYPLSFGKGVPGSDTVVVGGSVVGRADPAASWQTLKDTADGAALLMVGSDTLSSYDLHASNVFDMFRPRPPDGNLNGASFLLQGCYGTGIRDDAVENDDEMTGTVRGCLFDGINSGVSIGQNVKNPSAVTTIEDSTFIFRPMPNGRAPDGVGHAALFKQMGGGHVVMRNDIVCYQETPIGPDRLKNWMPGTYQNVTIVLGPGFDGDGDGDFTDLDHPGTLPPGVRQTRDWSLCGSSLPPTPSVPPPSVTPAPSVTPSPTVPPSTGAGSPGITGIVPFSAPVGSSIAITGSRFTGAAEVRFNGTPAAFRVDSDTRITAVVPDGATTGPISVVKAHTTYVSAMSFVVPATLSFTPTGDAHVSDADPTKNFGASTTLHIGQGPAKDALLKFDISGIGKRTVLSARLFLYCVRGSNSGGVFFPADNGAWDESTVSWRTAPPADPTAVGVAGAMSPGTWLAVDVTSVIRRDARYTLRVTSPASREVEYVSKEGAQGFRPRLVVTVG